jgi:DHA1 family tetracycline resistance protein-like MFS transporter
LGRKFALLCSHLGLIILATCGSLALYLHSPSLLILGFAILGLLNANLATGPALMSDISHDHNRVLNMATVQCFLAAGACIGPIIGGKLGNYHGFLQTPYVLPFIVIGIVALISLRILKNCPETLATRIQFNRKAIWKDYRTILSSRNVRQLLMLLILCQMSWGSYYELMPPVLKNIYHFSPAQVGLFVGMIAFWLIIATSIGIRFLLKFFNQQQLVWYSAWAVAIGSLLTWNHLLIWISAMLIAMGDVIFFALFISYLVEEVNPNQRSKIMGLTLTIHLFVWSCMAMIGGMLLSFHNAAVLGLIPVGALVLLCVLYKKKAVYYDSLFRCR